MYIIFKIKLTEFALFFYLNLKRFKNILQIIKNGIRNCNSITASKKNSNK